MARPSRPDGCLFAPKRARGPVVASPTSSLGLTHTFIFFCVTEADKGLFPWNASLASTLLPEHLLAHVRDHDH